MTLSLYPISAFNDNYIWALYDEKQAIIVDPGDVHAVLHFLSEKQLDLHAIFITHHHQDHTLGLPALKLHYPNALVYGPHDSVTGVDISFAVDTTFNCGFAGNVQVLTTPGHTLDHIVFYLPEHHSIFTGDTLFSGGCGRLFEGTPEQLFNSLKKISNLPPSTLVCCAHEYTLNNLRFAQWLEPNNLIIQDQLRLIHTLRNNNHPSLPILLRTELSYNPFLRTHSPSLSQRLQEINGQKSHNEQEIFTLLRHLKDHY